MSSPSPTATAGAGIVVGTAKVLVARIPGRKREKEISHVDDGLRGESTSRETDPTRSAVHIRNSWEDVPDQTGDEDLVQSGTVHA